MRACSIYLSYIYTLLQPAMVRIMMCTVFRRYVGGPSEWLSMSENVVHKVQILYFNPIFSVTLAYVLYSDFAPI